MTGITIIDPVQINSLIWIRSLADDELGPSRRMTEDLAVLAAAHAFGFEEKIVANRAELFELLRALAEAAGEGLRPILHFDCHGNAEEGLYLMPGEEFLGWAELADALRAINVATGNNLCCVFGACFGLWFSTALRLSLPSPYYLTIAPENLVYVDVLEARVAPFYRALFEGGHITRAYEDVLKPELKIFYCKKILFEALGNYVATSCTGRAARERFERTVTRLLRQDGISQPTGVQLRSVRTEVEAALKPSQLLIDHYASTFLIGRPPGFGYSDLKKRVDSEIRVRESRAARERRRGRG